MTYEFDGQTEEEAVQNAIDALHIEKRDFEYEIIQSTKRGLFKKPLVKIRVRVLDSQENEEQNQSSYNYEDDEEDEKFIPSQTGEPETDGERKLIDFIENLTLHIGFSSKARIVARGENGKVCIDLTCSESQYLIGHHGKMLDSLQVVSNAYCQRLTNNGEEIKVVLDIEGYRSRHEEKIIKDAISAARSVRKTGRSALLEPLNPYDRRLIHKALTKFGGVETESQGSGIEKRIRITKC